MGTDEGHVQDMRRIGQRDMHAGKQEDLWEPPAPFPKSEQKKEQTHDRHTSPGCREMRQLSSGGIGKGV
ncbi:hypothetical protein O9K51_02042 [Purpureocillium lavendulum]|uniref:Uncharacterized protein n=1 Tax=Purpureocillium lavendulum TaxID=1247861 RepID=A0AB34G6Q6_9HYPO|nr:hypothetical protein O9K51_02042 [Purpureocillium lavendulum]